MKIKIFILAMYILTIGLEDHWKMDSFFFFVFFYFKHKILYAFIFFCIFTII